MLHSPAPSPTPAPPAAPTAGDAHVLGSLRTLAIDTLSDLMRRGQPGEGRRHAATTALRYLTQLDRLAAMQRPAAAVSPPQPPASQSATPSPQSPHASPSPTASTIPQAVPQPARATAPAPTPIDPAALAALPSRSELHSLVLAVRETAASIQRGDDREVFFPPALDALPALNPAPLAIPSDPRFDSAAALPPRPTPPFGQPRAQLSPPAPLAARRATAAALLLASGFAASG